LEIVYFGDWLSAIVVFGKSPIWSKWSPDEMGFILQEYQYTVKAIKGSENVRADFFSRLW